MHLLLVHVMHCMHPGLWHRCCWEKMLQAKKQRPQQKCILGCIKVTPPASEAAGQKTSPLFWHFSCQLMSRECKIVFIYLVKHLSHICHIYAIYIVWMLKFSIHVPESKVPGSHFFFFSKYRQRELNRYPNILAKSSDFRNKRPAKVRICRL